MADLEARKPIAAITPEQIAAMTPEQRQQLAASMRVPIRCGGCDYDPDGARVYIIGGKRLRPAAFRAYQLSLGYTLAECRVVDRAGDPDVYPS